MKADTEITESGIKILIPDENQLLVPVCVSNRESFSTLGNLKAGDSFCL